MEEYLRASAVIDSQHPEIVELAKQIALGHEGVGGINCNLVFQKRYNLI